MRVSIILGPVSLATCLALSGCKKQAEPPSETGAGATQESTITETSDNGSISWDVGTDGQVRAAIKGPDGKPITKGVKGSIVWPGDIADTEAELAPDEKGVLTAAGPPLQEDLTELDYRIDVDGKPWSGALHVPRGGTQAIGEDARVAANTPVPDGKRGPNGGVIQYIGHEPVEVVADKSSQEVRLYVLGPDYKVIDPGERTVRLGYGAETPGMTVLVREPGANFYVGPWYAGFSPYRVTVAMTVGVETHVGIVGWSYGVPFRVGWGVGFVAPVAFVGVYGWAPSLSVRMGIGIGFGWGFGFGVYGGYRVAGGYRFVDRVGVGVRGWEHGDHGRHEGWGRGGEHGFHGGHEGGMHGGHEGGGHMAGHEGGGHGMTHGGGGRGGPGGGGHMSGAPARGGGGGRSGGGRHH
jgi:hypothetical protein